MNDKVHGRIRWRTAAQLGRYGSRDETRVRTGRIVAVTVWMAVASAEEPAGLDVSRETVHEIGEYDASSPTESWTQMIQIYVISPVCSDLISESAPAERHCVGTIRTPTCVPKELALQYGLSPEALSEAHTCEP